MKRVQAVNELLWRAYRAAAQRLHLLNKAEFQKVLPPREESAGEKQTDPDQREPLAWWFDPEKKFRRLPAAEDAADVETLDQAIEQAQEDERKDYDDACSSGSSLRAEIKKPDGEVLG